MTYVPELATDKDIKNYLQREFDKISEEFKNISASSINLEVSYSAPSRPVEHMIMSFGSTVHGTSGLYQYIGGSWVKL